MKKQISLLLVMIMVFTMLPVGMLTVSAADMSVVDDIADTDATADGIQVSELLSEINLTFTGDILAANAENISIAGVAPATFKGAIKRTIDTTAKTVKLEFGRLDEGSYTLTVPADVTVDAEDADYTKTFTAVEQGYDRNEEFSAEALPEGFTVVNDPTINYGKETGGDGYIEMIPKATGDTMIKMTVPGGKEVYNDFLTDDRDVYITEIGAKMVSTDGANSKATNRELFRLDNMSYYVGQFDASYKMKTYRLTGVQKEYKNTADGYGQMRAVMSRNDVLAGGGTQYQLVVELYDGTTNEYLGKTDQAHHWTSGAVLGKIYYGGTATEFNDKMRISYVREYLDRKPTVLNSGFDADSETVEIYISDDILSGSEEYVVFKDADDEEVAIETEWIAADRKIVVSFPDGIQNGAYTVDLSAVQSSRGIRMYEADATQPVAVAGIKSKLTSATPAAGEISTLQEKITLAFSDTIADTAASLEGITMTKKDGNPIKGIYNVEVDPADAKNVIVTFGRLEDGVEYKIAVDGAKVVTTGGESVASGAVEYTAKAPGYVVDENFDDWTPTKTYGTNQSITHSNAGVTTATGDESDKYLSVGQGEKLTYNTGLMGDLIPEQRNVYIVEEKLKPSKGADGAYGSSVIKGFGVGTNESLRFNSSNAFTEQNMTNSLYDRRVQSEAVRVNLDADGWATLRAVIMRTGKYKVDGSTRQWFIDIGVYDATNGSNKYLGTMGTSVNAPHYVNDMFLTEVNSGATDDTIMVTEVKAKLDKAMTVLKEEVNYKKADGKVVFYMSDDIYETEAVKVKDLIKVTDPSGGAVTDFSAAVDNTNRTITVSFPKGLATAGDYKVDLSRVLGTNGVAVWDGVIENWDISTETGEDKTGRATRTFNVAEGQQGLVAELTSASPATGEISTLQEEITLTFSDTIADTAASLEGITMTKKDGNPIKGIYNVEVDPADAKNVIVTFGRLEDGVEYKIAVDGAKVVTTGGGRVIDAAVEYTAKAPGYDRNEEFSTEALPAGLTVENNPTITYGTENGDGYIEMTPKATGDTLIKMTVPGGKATYNAFLTDDRDAYVTEIGAKMISTDGANSNAGQSTLFHIANTSNFAVQFELTRKMKTFGVIGGEKIFAPDSDGYGHMRAVMSRNGEWQNPTEAKLVVELYDGSTSEYLGMTDRITHYASSSTLAKIYYSSDNINDQMRISYVKEHLDRKPVVLKPASFDADSQTVEIYFSDDILSGAEEAIVFKDEDGDKVDISTTYSDAERKITVSFPYGIQNGAYTADLSAVQSSSGIRMYEDVALQNVNVEGSKHSLTVKFRGKVADGEFKKLSETKNPYNEETAEYESWNAENVWVNDATAIKIDARIGVDSEEIPAIFLAVHDKAGNLVEVKKAPTEVVAEKQYTATAEVAFDINEHKYPRVFVWESVDTITPLYEPLSCL